MRGDQPLCLPASETVSPSTGAKLITPVSRFARALAAVAVLQANDVVELRRRDLDDRGVLECGEPVHGARDEVKGRPRRDHLRVEDALARLAELELRPARFDVPGLVLLPVELEAERLARAHEEDLPDIPVGVGPDELPPPRLLDAPRLHRPAI